MSALSCMLGCLGKHTISLGFDAVLRLDETIATSSLLARVSGVSATSCLTGLSG